MELGNFFKELDTLFQTKNIEAAAKFITDAMKRVQEENDLPALLAISNELGGIFRVTNRFAEAKKVYGVALETVKLLGLENTEQHGTTILNLGSVYAEEKNAREAIGLYEKAAAIFAGAGLQNDYRMAALYNNMSHAYDLLDNSQKAFAYAERSLAIIRNLPGYDVELATSYTTLGTRYLRKGEYDEAQRQLKEAERIFFRLPGKRNVHFAATLNSMGDLCYRQGKNAEAAGYFEQALEIIKENYGENKAYAEVLQNLAKVRNTAQTAVNVSGMRTTPGLVNHMRMTGLGLSESYFDDYGRKMILEEFSDYQQYMAVGLVGEGSECYGFDDELSEDHDFGPGFCIWLPDHIYGQIGAQMKDAYGRLPKNHKTKYRRETPEGGGRVGIFGIGEFYKKYIGSSDVPKNNVEWIFSPETSLSTVTNGKVFEDQPGEFTRIRNGLLNYYPRDVLLKKLAARMAMMSQTGQYNYERCMNRREYAAAYLSCSEFVKSTVSIVYLLNRKYMPFYKWMFKGMNGLDRLKDVKQMLEQLLLIPDTSENTMKKAALIEDICIKIRDELSRQSIITGTDAFLNSHCSDVMALISDPQIRNLPVMFDGK
jgi:tetratricopeptide (TPR) repeat protein